MIALQTPRLLLLPLSRAMISRRLETVHFTLPTETPTGPLNLHFPPEWPGDPLPVFPAMLAHLSASDHAVWGSFVLVQRDTGRVLGLMGTKGTPDTAGCVEIGYGLIPAAWGQGYATEAVGELVRHLLALPNLREVTAETAVTNHASERVLQKLGFRCTGSSWSEDDGDLHTWALRSVVSG